MFGYYVIQGIVLSTVIQNALGSEEFYEISPPGRNRGVLTAEPQIE
jgi:hypothetical protein